MTQIYDHFRSIQNYWDDPEWLGNRMLFLSGPRQVGKTTLVKSRLCPDPESYFNWDNPKIRSAYRADPEFFTRSTKSWLCFDEIHKRPRWKDILKGAYDSHKERYHFVVTGSARLETFKKSGDSLVGRYFHTHLFPFNLSDFTRTDFIWPKNPEVLLNQAADKKDAPELEQLLITGGFPEPFFKGSEQFHKRWSEQHRDLILTEDLRELSRIELVDKIAGLIEFLMPAAGQLTNNNSLARDLETYHTSIKQWLAMLHKLHLIFPVTPYSTNIRRAYKKEKKWYFMDWCTTAENRFENYVAASLLRAVTLYQDRFGEKMSLHFVRTHDGHEVDFLLCHNKKPWLLVEVKEGKPDLSSAVYRFSHDLGVPCAVVTKRPGIYKMTRGKNGQKIYCLSWSKLGALLP